MKNQLLFILILFLLASCKKEDNQGSHTNTVSNNVHIDSFPLAVGHTWKYYSELHMIDSLGTNYFISRYDNLWSTVSDTFVNGELSTKILQIDSNYNGMIDSCYTYYANRVDGLYGVAYLGNGTMFYFKSTTPFLNINNSSFGLLINPPVSVDTVFVPATSLRLLKFPSIIHDSWLSYEYNVPIPDIIKRRWIGVKTITTNAGVFNCLELQMFWDVDNDNIPDSGTANILQYFSEKGLIQEEYHQTISYSGSNQTDSVYRISKLTQINF